MNISNPLVTSVANSFRSTFRKLRQGYRTGTVVVLGPTRTLNGDVSTIAGRIDGRQIWFSSRDVVLNPAVEALGSAFLIPATHAGRNFAVQSQVCDEWVQRLVKIPALLESWWNYAPIDIQVQPKAIVAKPSDARALAFSCGVDSFYSLLKHPKPFDALVCVIGFDVKLNDRKRTKALESSLRSVASEYGRKAICISTNLRQHPLLKRSPWERTHGGALAAIGHLLIDSYGTFAISSSGIKKFNHPWGSRWDLDPKFSSSVLDVEHFGENVLRLQKLTEIASEPIVRKHLRVCWEFRSKETNCGLCEKCVRTMLVLDSCDQLSNFPSFANVDLLADSIGKVPFVSKLAIDTYAILLQRGISTPYRSPVQRLIERSKAHHYGQA